MSNPVFVSETGILLVQAVYVSGGWEKLIMLKHNTITGEKCVSFGDSKEHGRWTTENDGTRVEILFNCRGRADKLKSTTAEQTNDDPAVWDGFDENVRSVIIKWKRCLWFPGGPEKRWYVVWPPTAAVPAPSGLAVSNPVFVSPAHVTGTLLVQGCYVSDGWKKLIELKHDANTGSKSVKYGQSNQHGRWETSNDGTQVDIFFHYNGWEDQLKKTTANQTNDDPATWDGFDQQGRSIIIEWKMRLVYPEGERRRVVQWNAAPTGPAVASHNPIGVPQIDSGAPVLDNEASAQVEPDVQIETVRSDVLADFAWPDGESEEAP